MRIGVVAALLCACHLHIYDPIDELEYTEHPDTASAVRAILDAVPAPRVYAVGEYHPTRTTVVRASPLARFTDEIIGLLEPRAQHLVIEAWLEHSCRGSAEAVGAQVATAIDRPPTTRTELAQLIEASRRQKLVTHALPMTCIEQSSLLDPRGRVDFLRLLETITDKLREAARALIDQGRSVIVYGGALHNDLYPRYAFEDLAYADDLARELGRGGVLELDLVVPEIVAPMPMVRSEPWFPLLGLASPERVIVWPRAPDSYVILLPAQSEDVGRIARPIAPRD